MSALICFLTHSIIQAVRYLEYVFPEKRLRYTAASNGEDSEKDMNDFSPSKDLFNERQRNSSTSNRIAILLFLFAFSAELNAAFFLSDLQHLQSPMCIRACSH